MIPLDPLKLYSRIVSRFWGRLSRTKVIPSARRGRTQWGMTLIEVLVAAVISMIVLGVAWSGLISFTKMSDRAEAKTLRQIELTQALDFIANDIKQASAVNQSGTIVADGSTVSLTDVLQNGGVTLSDLGSYGDISLYLEVGMDPSVKSCPAADDTSIPAEKYDRVVYDIRDSSAEWLPPKVIVRYGRLREWDGKINPCNTPVANDIIADVISDSPIAAIPCSGLKSGSGGLQVCTDSSKVDVVVTSAIQELGTREEKRTITTRVTQIS